jgi:elongation factor Ts
VWLSWAKTFRCAVSRFVLGEGIEKEETNFAEEVAAQTGKKEAAAPTEEKVEAAPAEKKAEAAPAAKKPGKKTTKKSGKK